MKKSIVEVLLASEKRRNVLLLLRDGPKEMEIFLKSLKTSRVALLPQMKILKQYHLISKYGDTYELTTLGKLIVEEMIRFLRTTNTFGENHEYFGTHYIDFIPPHFLKKIPELGFCNIEQRSINDFFEPDTEFLEEAMISKYWLEITSALHPMFHDFYGKMTDHSVDVSIILSQQAYEKLKNEYYDDFKKLIDIKLISFYVYPDTLDFASFVFTNHCISFRLFTKEGKYDNKKLLCCGQKTLEWGKELFEYYRQQSAPVIEI